MLWHGVDQGVIDGIVNGVGTQSKGIGGVLRLLQSGNIRSYATWVVDRRGRAASHAWASA